MIDPLRGWLHGRVRDLVSSLDAGVSVNGEEREKRNGEIAVLKVSSVSSMAFNPSECKPVVDEDIDRVKESPKKNHIIVSRSNTPALVGASALVRRDFPELFLSDKLWQLKLKPSRQTSPEWLALTLASRPIRTRLSHLATGTSSSMKNISKNDLLSLRIEIPLPAEQRKIAHIVQSWDRAISGTELLIAAKLEQRKGLMQQLLSGERRFPEFTDPWIEVRLGEILFEVNRPVDWDDDKTYQLVSVRRGSKGLFLRGLLKGMAIDTKKLHTIHTGDFLISKRQVVHGATGLTTKEFDGAKVSDSYTILRARDAGLLDIDFFTWLAKTPEMVRKTFLSSNGVHIEKLFFVVKDYLKRRILIPNDIAEQRKIVAVLITADREIALLRDQLAALKEQKKGLMQKLLTGKKRVKVTEEAA